MKEVRDPVLLIKACEKTLRTALDNQSIAFAREEEKGGLLLYRLIGSSASNARAKFSYKVIPLLFTPHGTFWLGGRVVLRRSDRKYYLESASLLVFEGEYTDNDKKPLLRAEWDSLEASAEGSHAQPHWHVYSHDINVYDSPKSFWQTTTEVVVTDFAPNDEETEGTSWVSSSSTWIKGEEFHFAMASRWHIDGIASHCEELDDSHLPAWLEGCIQYTRKQIEYLYL